MSVEILFFFFRKTDSEDSESNPDGGGKIRKKFKCFCFCCGKKSSDQDSDSDDEFSENHVNGGFEQEVVTNGNNPNSWWYQNDCDSIKCFYTLPQKLKLISFLKLFTTFHVGEGP